MAQITANGIQIEAETRGDPGAPALLLIRGLGTQLSQWPEPFLDALAERLHVITFDNRDVGLSQKLDAAGTPELAPLLAAASAGQTPEVPYRLTDMAADCVGVLDAFGIERAHVFGMSMGGMIAQLMAAHHPERVRSLTSMMSTSGEPDVPPATPEAMAVLTSQPERPDDRECVIEHAVWGRRVIGSPGFPDSDEDVRAELSQAYDRCNHPGGIVRQMAAVVAAGSRADVLRSITAPTLVIHGSEDALIHPEGGRSTARLIPGAALEMIEGMGHDLPRALAPRLADLVLRHAGKADASA